MTEDEDEDHISPDIAFGVMAALLMPRRPFLKKHFRISFALLEGVAWTLDTHTEEILRKGYLETADVRVITNTRTISDLLKGRFQPNDPQEGHLFWWTGDAEVLRAMAAIHEGSGKPWEVRFRSLAARNAIGSPVPKRPTDHARREPSVTSNDSALAHRECGESALVRSELLDLHQYDSASQNQAHSLAIDAHVGQQGGTVPAREVGPAAHEVDAEEPELA